MNSLSAVVFLTLCFIVLSEECINGPSYLYAGTHSTTKSGLTCQRWDTNETHQVKKIPEDGIHHNYCRNPDKDSRGTWCYTTDLSVRWEYCEIPKCENEVLAVWTSYDESEGRSYFDFVKADPELVSQSGRNSDGIQRKMFENAQFRGMEVSHDGEEIYYTDVRNNYFGVLNIETLEVERYLEGKADTIYAISQDSSNGRFYWTDTDTKSVMFTDRKFKSQVLIYNAAPSEPRAITVLPGNKGIVFSTYVKRNKKIRRGPEIIMTDKRGRNQKVLLLSPEVNDVTGLAADSERIYWTENLGYASKVMSCRFNGSDKIEHYFKKLSSFQDIAVYSDYIYVTDAQTRYNYSGKIRYHIDVIGKSSESTQVFTYTKSDIPHGIAIFHKKKETTVPAILKEKSSSKRKSAN